MVDDEERVGFERDASEVASDSAGGIRWRYTDRNSHAALKWPKKIRQLSCAYHQPDFIPLVEILLSKTIRRVEHLRKPSNALREVSTSMFIYTVCRLVTISIAIPPNASTGCVDSRLSHASFQKRNVVQCPWFPPVRA